MAMATHAGMTTEEFDKTVTDWLATAKHPNYRQAIHSNGLSADARAAAHLRANGFKTFIVSGGGIDFLRVFAEKSYGVPPEQVVGSSIKAKYELRDGKPVIVKLPELNFIDDKAGKPVGIHQHIGRRPIFAAGNSDGDFQMLEWTTAGPGPRFGHAHPPRRCRPRMGLRPRFPHRQARQGPRRRPQTWVDHRQHEE
jgi:hypothetical protein